MAHTIQVNIVSAEQSIFSGDAEMVVAPGETGELGILPSHAPLLTRIKPGTVKLKLRGRDYLCVWRYPRGSAENVDDLGRHIDPRP
jgi:ATP synthase F1 epsilon subunit